MKKFNIYEKLKEKGYSGKKSIDSLLKWLKEKDILVDFQWANEEDIVTIQASLTFRKNFNTCFYGEGYSDYSDALEGVLFSCYDYI